MSVRDSLRSFGSFSSLRSFRSLLSLCVLCFWPAVVSSPASAQSFLAWKGLSAGSYPVAFSTATVEDPTRTLSAPTDYLGRPRPGYDRRPIHIAVWQPAKSATSGTAMTYGDYLPLMAWDTGPEAEGAAERAVAELRYTQTVTPLAGPPDSASIHRLMGERVWARRDAEPAPGTFPVLVYAPGMGYPAFDNSVLFEYLASHGYMVVAAPSTGPDAGRIPYDAFGLEAQTRDLEFLTGYLRTLPQADRERIGTAGFSLGGLSSLFFALRDTRVKAVISLDGSVRAERSLAMARTFPEFRPERLRVPMLAFIAAPDPATPAPADESFLDQAKYSEITRAVVSGTVHHDFGSMSSLLQRASRDGKARDWAAATAGYEAICKLTLEFLDTWLKGTGAAKPALGSGQANVCTVSTRPAETAPPTPRDFLEVLDRDGVSIAIDMIRTAAKEHPDLVPAYEGATNQAGYTLLGAGRVAEAIAVLALGAEISPQSVNASDSLGEAYLTAGELDKAETCYLDAKSKLEKVKDLPAETRAAYVSSADRALAEITKRRQK